MSDRHEKWVRVEVGTTIPAGQPYRTESDDPLAVTMDGVRRLASEFVRDYDWTTKSDGWFIDSSWKPPLVLPTEPGSVILARRLEGPMRYWMRGDDRWIDGGGAWTRIDREADFNSVRVLFDPSEDDE